MKATTVKLVNFRGVDIGERLWTNGEVAKLYGPYSPEHGSSLDWRGVKQTLAAYSSLSDEEQAELIQPLFDLAQPRF